MTNKRVPWLPLPLQISSTFFRMEILLVIRYGQRDSDRDPMWTIMKQWTCQQSRPHRELSSMSRTSEQ